MKVKFPAVGVVLAALAILAPAAWAVYGPEAGQQPPIPSGYSQILTAHTFGSDGGSLQAEANVVLVQVDVPRGAFDAPAQVQLRKADLAVLTEAVRTDGFGHHKLVSGFAVGVANVGGVTVTHLAHSVRVVLNVGRRLVHRVFLVQWNAHLHSYRRVNGRTRIRGGKLILTTSIATAYAVLAN